MLELKKTTWNKLIEEFDLNIFIIIKCKIKKKTTKKLHKSVPNKRKKSNHLKWKKLFEKFNKRGFFVILDWRNKLIKIYNKLLRKRLT